MNSRLTFSVLGVVLAASLIVAGLYRLRQETSTPDTGRPPCNRAEILARAQSAGLHFASSSEKTQFWQTFLLSDRPLSEEAEYLLNVNDPKFERWHGVVRVYLHSKECFEIQYDETHPERYALWGDTFVFGDPEIIKTLLTAHENGPRPSTPDLVH